MCSFCGKNHKKKQMSLKAYNDMERRKITIRYAQRREKMGNLTRVVLRSCNNPKCMEQFSNYHKV